MTTRHGSRGAQTFLTAAFVLLVACLLGPSAARAQWTAPDASNNISNTNTGNVGINVTAPVFRFEVRGTASRNTASFFGDGDSIGYAGIRIAAFTTTGIANNRTSTFNLHMRKDTWYGGDGSGPSFIIETTTKGGGFAAPFLITPTNDIILNSGRGAGGPAGSVPPYGNVGIGTHTPAYKLDVSGSVNASGLCLGGDCKTAWSQVSGFAASGSSLYFNTGNVGLGTNSPAFKLDAAGAIRGTGDNNVNITNQYAFTGGGQQHYFDGGVPFAPLGRGSANAYYGTSTGVGSNPGGIFVGGFGNQNAGAAGIYAQGGDTHAEEYNRAWGGVGLFAQGGQNGPHTGGPYGWAYSRYAAAAFFNGYVQIGSNDGRQSGLAVGFDGFNGYGAKLPSGGGLLVNGSVGVGTATPAFKLDVQGGQLNASGGLCIAGDCRVSWAQVTSGSSATQWSNGASGTISYSSGFVGVGTASPVRPLNVDVGALASNGMRVSRTAAANNPYFDFMLDTSGTPYGFISVGDNLAYRNIALAPFGGNVGIGTASPAVKLHVAGGGRLDGTAGRIYLGTGAVVGARGLEFVEENATTFSIRHHDPNVAWRNIAINPYGGNVGVGTASPAAKLDVRVTSLAAGSNTALWSPSGSPDMNTSYVHYGTTGDWYIRPGTTTGKVIMGDNGGTVGIGTASPNAAYKLDVAGSVNASGLCLGNDCKTAWSQVGGGTTSQWVNGASSSINYTAGNVGVGTTTPIRGFQISGPNGSVSSEFILENTGMPANNRKLNLWGSAAVGASGRFFLRLLNDAGSATTREFMSFDNATGNVGIGTASPTEMLEVNGPGEVKTRVTGTLSAGIQFRETNGAATWSEWQQFFDRFRLNTHDGTTTRPDVMSILPNGNVGIGKATPTEALDVVGNIKATGSVSATYQDVAEWVPSVQKLQAGTVVVLDTGKTNHVMASAAAYDTKVAGVISEQPGIILGVGGEGKVKVATTGRVKVKVDATRAPVKVGDLLVTSDVEGVAMKSEPISIGGRQMHAPGTIIGKALEPLEKGVAEILVLLSLQ